MAGIVVKRWLTEEEALDYLGGISASTLKRLVDAGRVHKHKVTDSKNRSPFCFDARELDEYMESRRTDKGGVAPLRRGRKAGR